jgi:hypothetical protein
VCTALTVRNFSSGSLRKGTARQAKEDSALPEWFANGPGLVQLQLAIAQVSDLYWEDLWNDTHPDQFGQSRDQDDFELMPVWREKVRKLIEECHQEWLLTVDAPEEYKETLMAAGASDGAADRLVDWLSMVRSEQEV